MHKVLMRLAAVAAGVFIPVILAVSAFAAVCPHAYHQNQTGQEDTWQNLQPGGLNDPWHQHCHGYGH